MEKGQQESASIQEAFPGIGPKQCQAISILRPDISWCQCLHTTENASESQGWDPAASFQERTPRPSAHVAVILTNSPFPWKLITQNGNAPSAECQRRPRVCFLPPGMFTLLGFLSQHEQYSMGNRRMHHGICPFPSPVLLDCFPWLN